MVDGALVRLAGLPELARGIQGITKALVALADDDLAVHVSTSVPSRSKISACTRHDCSRSGRGAELDERRRLLTEDANGAPDQRRAVRFIARSHSRKEVEC